jgi:hypothetical protein
MNKEFYEILSQVYEKLGITGTHVDYPDFRWYTNDEGDYWSLDINTEKGKIEIACYDDQDIRVTQSVDDFYSLEEVLRTLKKINEGIAQDETILAEKKKRKRIVELKKELSILEGTEF